MDVWRVEELRVLRYHTINKFGKYSQPCTKESAFGKPKLAVIRRCMPYQCSVRELYYGERLHKMKLELVNHYANRMY